MSSGLATIEALIVSKLSAIVFTDPGTFCKALLAAKKGLSRINCCTAGCNLPSISIRFAVIAEASAPLSIMPLSSVMAVLKPGTLLTINANSGVITSPKGDTDSVIASENTFIEPFIAP